MSESILIDGDIVTPVDSVIIFTISKNSDSVINVNGCLRIEGKINVSLTEQPQKGATTIVLIRYNCTTTTRSSYLRSLKKRVDSSQVVVSTDYQNSKCDQVSSTVNQDQSTLSVSLSSTINGNCKGKTFKKTSKIIKINKKQKIGFPIGAILGIVLGAVGVTLLIIFTVIFFKKREERKFDDRLNQIGEEMRKMK